MSVISCFQVGAIFDRFESLAQEEKTTLLGLFDPGQYKVTTVLKFRFEKFHGGIQKTRKGTELEDIL